MLLGFWIKNPLARWQIHWAMRWSPVLWSSASTRSSGLPMPLPAAAGGSDRDITAYVVGDLFGRLRLKYFAQEFVGLHGQTLKKTAADGKREWITKWTDRKSTRLNSSH